MPGDPVRRALGGRRGRAYGWISALSSLGIVVGATVSSQVWDRTGDVGFGQLTSAIGLVLAAGFWSFRGRQRPELDGLLGGVEAQVGVVE